MQTNCRLGGLVGIFMLCLHASLAWGEVRGLVIGIDNYVHVNSLHGAVNDARDIAQALERIGVKDIQTLIDERANRDAIVSAWQGLLSRAKADDIIVLSYAGHGAQEPERVPGSEQDGKDEVLVLGGFAPSGPASRERIVDDELFEWFVAARDKGVAVLFVADACHSGTLTRDFDDRAGKPSVRSSTYTITDDMLDLDLPPAAASVTETDVPNVTFLAAGQEYQKVPELPLPDASGKRVQRGAMSYAVARALEGRADADHDGRLSRPELFQYVRENVRILAEARQTPNLLPDRDAGGFFLVLAKPSSQQASTLLAPAGISIYVQGMDPPEDLELIGRLQDAIPARRADEADLVFDAKRRQVVSSQGDIIATDIAGSDLQGVVDKTVALMRLRANVGARPLILRIRPDDGVHRRGQYIAFEIADPGFPYLTQFSLSGDGTVHFHYPVEGDPQRVSPGEPIRYEFSVDPPSGRITSLPSAVRSP